MQIIHSEPIESFPFERMSRAMEMVGWKWFIGRTPSGPELQLEASRMLRDLQKRKDSKTVASGGLVVSRDGNVGFEAKSGKLAACQKAWEYGGPGRD
jgi:hypothetical protein